MYVRCNTCLISSHCCACVLAGGVQSYCFMDETNTCQPFSRADIQGFVSYHLIPTLLQTMSTFCNCHRVIEETEKSVLTSRAL
jgi:hypothetical protein